MTQQMTLLDVPDQTPAKRKPKPALAPQSATETIPQTLARYAREAAEIRANLAAMQRFASVKVAKKSWTCSGCGCAILPGQRYIYSYATGGVDERRDCVQCVEMPL